MVTKNDPPKRPSFMPLLTQNYLPMLQMTPLRFQFHGHPKYNITYNGYR